MPEKKSVAHVLSVLVERLNRIESDAAFVRAVVSRMAENARRQGEPVSGKGSEPVAAPEPS